MTHPLVLSTGSLASKDPDTIVASAHSYLTVLLQEGGTEANVHPDALLSQAIGVLDAQIRNGGFSQFVYNTRWDDDVVSRTAAGLERIGADGHLTWFADRERLMAQPWARDGLIGFLTGSYFGDDPYRDRLDDGPSYFDLPDLAAPHAAWLSSHPDLVPHSIDDMFARVEKIVGHPVSRT